jgi:NAD(P)-dependent dehydrogenase (short-subunit alcohol dehydrogenase family)
MKVIVVGATGTIGKAVVRAIESRHVVVPVSRSGVKHRVDLADADSIKRLFLEIGPVDGVISAAASARFGPLVSLTDEDFRFSLTGKLMGQVNLLRLGLDYVADRGCFTLTSGVLGRSSVPGSAAVSLANAGVEGFVRAAALEMPRGIRINVVSPGWRTETLESRGMDPGPGTPAAVVARAYVQSLEGKDNGTVIQSTIV